MKYNFDEPVKRAGTDSLKWDINEGEIPMWVADMDFKTAPEIISALDERVSHGVFGYSVVQDSWYDAYISWWQRRHNFQMKKDWLIFSTGVVPAVSSAVRKLSTAGEKVLIQSPVYNIFYNSIVNNGRHILESPLTYNGRSYEIDFADLEEKLRDPQTSLMILCNPHNPVGKIWKIEELQKIGRMCRENNVVVLSDEIHCDLTDPGKNYTPFASVSDDCRYNSVTFLSGSKAFNLAGMHSAAAMVPGENLRNKINRALNTDEIAEPNSFAVPAVTAAFNHGESWLEELREYLYQNKQFIRNFISERIPLISVLPSEATYLLWLDCSQITQDSRELCRFIREKTGLYLTDGAQYGTGGSGFLRMNTACPRSTVEDALSRLEAAVKMIT